MVARGRDFLTLSLVGLVLLAGCTTPAATSASKVTDLRIEQVPDGARLTWDEFPRGVAKSFIVLREGQKIGEVQSPLRTFLDKAVEPGKAYRYAVDPVMPNGSKGGRSSIESFTFQRSLALQQDERVNRGFVNLTVVQVTPGVRWADLKVIVGGAVVARDDGAYRDRTEAWTSTSPREPLVDLGEKLQIFAPGKAKRNATIEVQLTDGTRLVSEFLQGRPTLNLTLKQERNATANLVGLQVLDITWRDGARDVTSSFPSLIPRWSALTVRVNGTLVPYSTDQRVGSWYHSVPSDDVIRRGGHLSVQSPLIVPGAVVVVTDAEATEESFRTTLR